MVNTYDNYKDAIDKEGVGATVMIGGKLVKAETKDGYTGKGSSSNNNNGIIGNIKAVGNSMKEAVVDFAGSHGLDDATYSVGADGITGISKGGLNDATPWDLPKLVINSIVDPVEAAKLNPYWDQATNTYDKSRDINGDGLPDYDIHGNSIYKTDNIEEVKNANGNTVGWQKMRGDGTPVSDKESAGKSDFDVVVEEANTQALALAQNQVQATSDSLKEVSSGDNAMQTAEQIVSGEGQLPGSSSVVEATKGITVDADAEGTTLDGADPKYALDTSGVNSSVETVDDVATVDKIATGDIASYTVKKTEDKMTDDIYQVDPVTGEITDKELVDADDFAIDMKGMATGVNEDGSINLTGKALDDYATQNTANIVDTSTPAGKLLAIELGEGNYTDSKSTILGQIGIVTKLFQDSQGNAIIPPSHHKVAASVKKIIKGSGVSGTAAHEMLVNALMGETLNIATDEAAGFRAIDKQNLDNRQEATINKAAVLSNFEMANLDAREAAAVQNATAFMTMNLENLSNMQKAEEINKQFFQQALFEDTKAVNTERMFVAQTMNDFTKFYDELGLQVQQYNATSKNELAKFNAGEKNDNSDFNATLENNRQQFNTTMQFEIDTANAKWRQAVTTKNTELKWEAASADAKLMFDLSTEALNQIWDRADAIFDYAWKTSENEANRDNSIALANIQASASGKDSTGGFWGALARMGGSLLGTEAGASWLMGLSDVRLKENIEKVTTFPSGINIYRWEWNDKARELGINVPSGYGVLAQEVQKTHPEMVAEHENGYLVVDYGKLK